MTGNAADAELDEALALVNEDRERAGMGAVRPARAAAVGAGAGNGVGAGAGAAASTGTGTGAGSGSGTGDGAARDGGGGSGADAAGATAPAQTSAAPDPHAESNPASPPPHSPEPPKRAAHSTRWTEARAIARRAGVAAARAAVSPEVKATLLSHTLGRTLAAPLTALTDLPSFDTSAMDGWAVAGPGPWTLLSGTAIRTDDGTDNGTDNRPPGILAGQDTPDPLGDGEAVPIATGARIPRDTTAVIRSEHGHADDKGYLHARREVAPGQDIRPRGQECRAGDRLLPPGALVTPAVLGLAAAAGYDALYVTARPRVEVLVLGDELLTSGLPQEGHIRDALGPMLPPWLRALGAEVTAVRRLGDDAEALHEALATATADVVVTTGGTASGPVDHVHPTLRRLNAELLVDGVAVRPGHPMLLARLPATAGDSRMRHLVGLPGNPLAAVSGLLTLAEPLLRGLGGRPAAEPYTAPVRDDVPGHPHDTRLVPVALRGEYAVPLHYNGPAMLRSIAVADGLAVIPPRGAGRQQELELLELPWTEPGGIQGELGASGADGEVCFT
ncbi:molybdopterin molybdotransferase MoeA [Streptomyces aureocirculatus]|uniref:molybdopterin molybdotransferase MoeA n=1 Tax=Streptomyces aureocirculatus TaxID=67275 RepID=UPI000A6873B9|nr:molybdopterin molybdotransferase MoeA [Streptomyces aureocirculatus]